MWRMPRVSICFTYRYTGPVMLQLIKESIAGIIHINYKALQEINLSK